MIDRAYLRSMLRELERSHLIVVLVPAKRGNGKVRQADEQNPDWYRDMCAAYPSTRFRHNHAPDTRIRRREVLICLRKMADGKPVAGAYVERILTAMAYAKRQDAKRDEYENRRYK